MTEIEAFDLLTARQAATLKGVELSTVYKARGRGGLPRVSVLGKIGFWRADIEAWTPKRGGVRPGSGRKPKEQCTIK